MNVTLRQLRAFAAVAEQGSFTEAARQLHLTQSAISMLVKQLEGECGLALFNRVGRQVTLTETGRELLPLARRMLDDLRQVIDGATDLRALRRGHVRVGASHVLACTWIPEALARFEALHPDVTVKLVDTSADEVIGAVQRHEVDIAIGPERNVRDDIASEFLWQVPIHVVCADTNPLARRRHVRWQDLKRQRWVVYSAEFTRHLERTLAEHDVQLGMERTTAVNHLTTALALSGRGLGLTAAPAYAQALAPHFGVRFLAVRGPSIERAFFVYHRRGYPLSPATSAFVAMLKHVLGGG